MPEPVTSAAPPGRRLRAAIQIFAPGVALSAAVAVAAVALAPVMPPSLPIPAMVIALIVGMALNPVARALPFQPGMSLCVKTLLRWAVALLGLRVALSDIVALGPAIAVLVVVSMAITLVSGMALARLLGQSRCQGALAGVAVAVCGASATLAASTVIPNYRGKDADVAFVIVGVNVLATLAMLLYPPLCYLLGFDAQLTGTMLGGTIHDVAQVVGAGYAVSEEAGNAAVIVKLFRVFLLLPVVLAVGWYFTHLGGRAGDARVPVPVFALMFLALCILNSVMSALPALAPAYVPAKDVLVAASTWGLLLAIGALGLGTSFSALVAVGWRSVIILVGTTLIILVAVTGGLMIVR